MILNYYLDQPYNNTLTKQERVVIEKQIQELKTKGKSAPDKLSNELFNSKETSIYVFAQVGKVRVKVKSGFRVLARYWDFDTQEVKKSFTGNTQFNLALNNLKSELTTKYLNLYTTQEGLSIQELKELVANTIHKKEPKDTRKDFYEAYEQFIEVKSSTLSPLTIKKYKTLLKLLKNFEEIRNYPISFNNINMRFSDLFTTYLIKDQKQTNNTVEKYVSTFKTFMHYATDRGLNTVSKDFIKFKASTERVDIVCLTEEELMKLYTYDFSSNKTLERVRDTYCFSSFTGQRFSDLENLKWDDIKENQWHLRTKKTKDNIKVPLVSIALEILEKYKGQERPLPMISNQKSNTYIKEVCRIAGIDEIFSKTQYRGSEMIVKTAPKHEFISFHSGRRNFCTINLSKGLSPEIIMKVTGHKDYKVFKKYVGLTTKQVEDEFSRVWNE
jgi:integrase